MSKGAIIFAYNSELNYTGIATLAARLLVKYLDIQVTLVTNDTTVDDNIFDKIIIQPLTGDSYERVFCFGQTSEKIQWHNQNRSSAYDLSPYDQTLLIDADYLVFSNNLKNLFSTNLEFACYNQVHEISGGTNLQEGARVGVPGIPMQWATVVYFTKSKLAKNIFNFMQGIKENYLYYSAIYNFDTNLFRNDYTLSIALQALTGYSVNNFTAIPGTLITAGTSMELVEVRPNKQMVFKWSYISNDNVQRNMLTRIKDTDIHIMNKRSIADPKILSQLADLAQ